MSIRSLVQSGLTGCLLAGCILLSGWAWGLSNEKSSSEGEKMLRHVVLFKFKDSASKEVIAKTIEQFKELPSKISEIAAFEYGTDNSPEGLANGFTHCFLITFKSEKDREAYLPHPAHKAFVDLALPQIDKVLVVDYWASK